MRDRSVARVTGPRLGIALVTGGALNGRRLSRLLTDDGVAYDLLTISPPTPRRGRQPLAAYLRRLLRSHVVSIGWLRRVRHARLPRYAVRDHFVGRCNGPRMLAALRAARPDVILMMGGGILAPEIIETARIGVLNAHPGLLPWIRGVDVVRHAVLRDVPVGVTLHHVDEGIDTGRIIRRWLVPVHPGDDTAAIAERADHLGNAAMRWAVHQLLAGRPLDAAAQTERFPLCRMLPPTEAAAADRAIADGAAARLYERARAVGDLADGAELLPEHTRA